MYSPTRRINRSRQAFENQTAERFFKIGKRLKSTLLAVIPANLSGKRTRITLLDETRVTGVLNEIDEFGNIFLIKNVTIEPPAYKKNRRPVTGLWNVRIHGKRVRYIELPEDTDISTSIANYLEATKEKPKMPKLNQPKFGGAPKSGMRPRNVITLL